jgi:hypothetical protein
VVFWRALIAESSLSRPQVSHAGDSIVTVNCEFSNADFVPPRDRFYGTVIDNVLSVIVALPDWP